MDPIMIVLALVLIIPALLAMVLGIAYEKYSIALLGILLIALSLGIGFRADYDNGLTVDSPGYDNTVHVFINVTTPAPTPDPGDGWSCSPVNNSTVPGEVVCRPVTLGAGP